MALAGSSSKPFETSRSNFFVALAPSRFFTSVWQSLTWACYSVESAVEAVDKLPGSGNSDVKTSHQFLNGKVSQSEKLKVGMPWNFKDFSGKRLCMHHGHRRVQRQQMPVGWFQPFSR